MSDPSVALFAAVEAALRGSAALATAMGLTAPRIYAGVIPANAPLPHVLIGDDQVIGADEDCTDAAEVFVTVNAWSRPNPPQANQVRAMAAAIRTALTAQLAVSGQDTVDWLFESARYLTDPDGSSHAVLSFRYQLTPS